MNKDIFTQTITDWRFHVLLVLTMVGIVLTASTTNSVLAFIVSKALGLATLFATISIAAYWYGEGHLSWIGILLNDEEED